LIDYGALKNSIMEYREIGKKKIRVSLIGFGGMRLPEISGSDAKRTILSAFDHGINFFETGWEYGEGRSERLIGQTLKNKRDKVILANKSTAYHQGSDEIERDLHRSLRNEQTEYFDIYSFWGVNTRDSFQKAAHPECIDFLLKAKEEGKIQATGITTHAPPDEIIEFADKIPLDCVTLKYNILTPRMEKAINALRQKNISIVIMSPLAGGMIASPKGVIQKYLVDHKISAATLGLRYLSTNKKITSILSGMRSEREVRENIRTVDGTPLTDVEKMTIEFIKKRLMGLGERFCTACNYCLPCPQGVAIADIFKLKNIIAGFGADEYSKGQYWRMQNNPEWSDYHGETADKCIGCGECEQQCPERLPIIDDLKKAHDMLSHE